MHVECILAGTSSLTKVIKGQTVRTVARYINMRRVQHYPLIIYSHRFCLTWFLLSIYSVQHDYLSRGWHLLRQYTLYLVTSYFTHSSNTQCCCAQARLLGLATHSNTTSDHKMIYRQSYQHLMTSTKIFAKQHYSATSTQVLITHYIAENLYYWTQNAIDKSFA